MSLAFSPISINGMELQNRFMRSATYDGMAERGRVTRSQVELFRKLAEGGAGLLVSGLMTVSPSGALSPFQNRLYDDSYLPGLRELTRAVHERGGKVAAQLAHAGREARSPQGGGTGWMPAGPSAQETGPGLAGPCRAMSEDEIKAVVQDFGRAAGRAREAGFDAVQLHAAHAYLPAQFLSPLANRREDRWGGSLDNRLSLHLKILAAVRRQVGTDYPVLVKLGVADGAPGGLGLAEGLAAAKKLAGAGCDCLEISQGLRGDRWDQTEFRVKLGPDGQEYFSDWAAAVKERVKIPVAMVGGLRDFGRIALRLESGQADIAALCRPLIQEPDLVARWRQDPGHRPGCVSCNGCLALLRAGRPLACAVTDQEAKSFLQKTTLGARERDS